MTLLDYGAGNVRSVRNAINLLGYRIQDVNVLTKISLQFVIVVFPLKMFVQYPSFQVNTPEDILKAKKLIFPGVGAFAAAMNVINERG